MVVDIGRWSSVTALLRHQAASRPGQDAVVRVHDASAREADHLSYATLDERARTVAVWLRERFAVGSRILLLYPPADFTTGFLGCLYAGMVAVPAPLPGRYHHERRRVRGIASDAGVSAVLTDLINLDAVARFAGEQLGEIDVLATDSGGIADPASWTAPATVRDDIALLQYTSGSTGSPKGVVVSHANLLVNAEALCTTLQVEDGTRFGGWAPQYHDMGLMAQTLPALFLGSTCVLMSPTSFLKRPHQWLQMIDRYDVAWSPAPNFGYELAARRTSDDQVAELDLSRWRYAVNGSEPVRVSTMEEFAERFAPAGFRAEAQCACYGLAEATVFVSGSAPREPVTARVARGELDRHVFAPVPGDAAGRALASNGFAAESYDVIVVDPLSREVLPERAIGELWLRGASVAHGYWNNAAATERTFRATTADGDGEFLRTGDLGTVVDGELYVTGRLKEMLVLRGRNLYPHDVEQEVRSQHPELGNVGAVFDVDVPGDDAAVVITHEVRGNPAPRDLAELATAIRRTVSREFGVPVGGVVLLGRGAVRRTTSGKIERAQMKSSFCAGELEARYAEVDSRLPGRSVRAPEHTAETAVAG
ncbi:MULTISPECIES: fatty acyl-AMP ligase [unclassified Saccharopolyspora]|uniref:fatty acyl-AMP ligase n=1 Tax=unclassified Saccharopolyspora TaxID=2646250 RepID=UPI001CD73654|nr:MULTISPECIES: fatty acyl-AMP ligase [unclassified Saccharopolyspora]MCA1185129.1 fatty acyl-AMP ligase [Saccharopolyspora sp. 6T]MCA1191395.1 fatty acyl-AMP ligase [Saccharopolyspora sp. 6V]MCA1225004.1 fatty acyl-AMP ligase [Saccharopolyspora sp. 6M]MCA1278505.1 fatty acyl-AMP ligase [Saccharopolyspora sp. 7B]